MGTPSWIVPTGSPAASNAAGRPSWVVSGEPAAPKAATNSGFDPNRQGTHEGAFDYLNGRISGDNHIKNEGQWVGGEGGTYQDNFVDTYDHGILKDAVSMTGRDFGGEDAIGHGPGYQLDYLKLPNQGMTKFGRIDQVYQVNGLDDVLNPNAVVWDDNYGWVTHKANRKPRLGDKIGPAIASLAMGGLMGAALPAGMATSLFKTGFNAMPGLAKGNINPVNLGLGLAGSFAGSLGVPSWVVPAAKTGIGLANMYNQGRG